MSTSNNRNLICLPAHILDAHITPRAREVLMLLASQTSAENPTLWICQKTIAERLRCSVATVARTIQKLVEAKLIAETGKLHQGKYKFYHVRWSSNENLKAVSKKITKPVRKIVATKNLPEKNPPTPFAKGGESPALVVPTTPSTPRTPVAPSTITPQAIMNDSRIAYYAEIARLKHQENKRRYQEILLSLR